MSTTYPLHKSNGLTIELNESSGILTLAADDEVAGYSTGEGMTPQEAVVVAMKLLAAASYQMDEDDFESLTGTTLNRVYRLANGDI